MHAREDQNLHPLLMSILPLLTMHIPTAMTVRPTAGCCEPSPAALEAVPHLFCEHKLRKGRQERVNVMQMML